MIAEAEGEAEAIEKVMKAQARGAEMLANVGMDNAYLKLKSLETFEKVADGKATKIVVPSNLQDLASILGMGKEIISKD